MRARPGSGRGDAAAARCPRAAPHVSPPHAGRGLPLARGPWGVSAAPWLPAPRALRGSSTSLLPPAPSRSQAGLGPCPRRGVVPTGCTAARSAQELLGSGRPSLGRVCRELLQGRALGSRSRVSAAGCTSERDGGLREGGGHGPGLRGPGALSNTAPTAPQPRSRAHQSGLCVRSLGSPDGARKAQQARLDLTMDQP